MTAQHHVVATRVSNPVTVGDDFSFVGSRRNPGPIPGRNDAVRVAAVSRGTAFLLPERQDLANHSPDGFEWGYGGSGPTQLALAILSAVTDDKTALEHYRRFKDECVSRIQYDSWRLSAKAVREWLDNVTRNDQQRGRLDIVAGRGLVITERDRA